MFCKGLFGKGIKMYKNDEVFAKFDDKWEKCKIIKMNTEDAEIIRSNGEIIIRRFEDLRRRAYIKL